MRGAPYRQVAPSSLQAVPSRERTTPGTESPARSHALSAESGRARGDLNAAHRQLDPAPSSYRTVEDEFLAVLSAAGMSQALALLNSRTRYRFTGVFRVEPPLLRNECLFDRENPSLSLGGTVTSLDRTFCGIVASTYAPLLVADASTDPRVVKHPARDSVVSYVGVPVVRSTDGGIFATLCHYDLRPRILPLDELAVLESIARRVSDWLVTSN